MTGILCAAQEAAPANELGFTLGGITPLSRSTSQQNLDLGAGTAFGVNYGRQLVAGNKIARYGEIDLLASPVRDVSSNIGSATKNFASLYVTPGVRVKFFPTCRISPYATAGGGYGDYEQSTTRLDGQSNPASRQLARGVFDFGAGSMFVSGDGLPFEAKLAISTRVLLHTTWQVLRAASTT